MKQVFGVLSWFLAHFLGKKKRCYLFYLGNLLGWSGRLLLRTSFSMFPLPQPLLREAGREPRELLQGFRVGKLLPGGRAIRKGMRERENRGFCYVRVR